ncbi:signal peptidase I [Haloarchaeobius amylolyticus]|uniref:signal peptidase I n=1 Tax=Haloarchaeobius amylolyticus TaxID=1198296 RepID=UPI002271D81F|nr:signal peptidase I [Haloarchaeobius amylolyticus]
MGKRRSVLLFCVLLGATVVLAPIGGPVSVSYVYSDSMAPTIEPYDGYLLVPAGEVATGDVVTFWSDQQDEFVTHRVVGVTDEGLVTKGDANPTTDQASGHPPVDRADVTGKVLRVDGSVVTIPGFGRGVETLREQRSLILAGAVAVTLASVLVRGRDRYGHDRALRYGTLYVAGFLLLAGVLTAVMLSTAVRYDWEFVVTATGGQYGPAVGEPGALNETIATGTSAVSDHFVHTTGLRDVQVTSGAARGRVRVAGVVPARETTGVQRTSVTVYRYPAFAPEWLVTALRRVHPVAAVFGAVTATIAVPFGIAGALGDHRRPCRLFRPRGGDR